MRVHKSHIKMEVRIMKVILLQDVKSLGKKDEIVEVSDGYARNFVFPKKVGVEANAKNLNELKLKKAHEDKVAAEKLADAKALADKMKDESITVSLKVGEGGKTFGSISSKEIAEEMKKQLGYDIDKKKIVLKESIKSVGTHIVDIKLHSKVTAQISVKVAEGK